MIVSIIVPCYNQAQYLDECLDSIYNQTYRIWECLIINDGSTDNTAKIALAWTQKDTRFKYYYKTNGGLSSARNYGLRKASGDVVQFLDSDDLIEKNKLEREADFLEGNPKIDLVYSSAKFFFNDKVKETYFSREKDGSDWTFERISPSFDFASSISEWNIMVVSAPMVRKTLCDKVGFFDEKLKSLEDWDFWIRCILTGGAFHYLNATCNSLTKIRCYQGSMSTNIEIMRENELKLRFKYRYTFFHNDLKYEFVKGKLLSRIMKMSKNSRILAIKLVFKNINYIELNELSFLLKSILLRNVNAQ